MEARISCSIQITILEAQCLHECSILISSRLDVGAKYRNLYIKIAERQWQISKGIYGHQQ